MSDRFLEFTQTAFGKQLAGMLGLSPPARLRRAEGGYADQALAGRAVLVGGAPTAQLAPSLLPVLARSGADLYIAPDHAGLAPIKAAASQDGLTLKGEPAGESLSFHALVFDASGIDSTAGLRSLYEFLQPRMARLASHGRVVILSRAPSS